MPGTRIAPVELALTNDDIGFDEEITLILNYADRDADTPDFFVIKELRGRVNRAEAFPPSEPIIGAQSELRNASFLTVRTMDGSPNFPYTAAHEAGRLILDFSGIDPDRFNVMTGTTSTTESIAGTKRLTVPQHLRSRHINDLKMLRR